MNDERGSISDAVIKEEEAKRLEAKVTDILKQRFNIGQIVPFNKISFRVVGIDRGCLVLRAEGTTEKAKRRK